MAERLIVADGVGEAVPPVLREGLATQGEKVVRKV